MTPVTLAGGQCGSNHDLLAPALQQQVHEFLDHRRRHRCRLGQIGEDNSPSAHNRANFRERF
jgi:hypothetical protein